MDTAYNNRTDYTVPVKEKRKFKVLKRVAIALFIILLLGIANVIYLWNKPHRKIEAAKSISISAPELEKQYSTNEKEANAKYLNKGIEVTGVVNEVDKNQDGGIMVILQTEDAIAGVQCTMRDNGINVKKGDNVTIKGFCSGNGITGVSLTDCVLK